jgi:hypothetical protein
MRDLRDRDFDDDDNLDCDLLSLETCRVTGSYQHLEERQCVYLVLL